MRTLFLDIPQSSQSSGTPIVAKSSESAPQTDGSPTCVCTKETSGCSIHPNTRDEWIASMQASLVLILAALEIKPESAKAREADFIEKCSELLTLFDHDTCIWRTSQRSLLTNSLEPFSETWPRAGMMRDGRVYQHRQPVPATTVIDGGCSQRMPTLTIHGNYNRKGASKTSGDGLITRLKMRPTLCARDSRTVAGSQPPKRAPKSGLPLTWFLGGDLPPEKRRGLRLNPTWALWYMGWPMTWFMARSKLSATPKSRSKPRLRGKS